MSIDDYATRANKKWNKQRAYLGFSLYTLVNRSDRKYFHEIPRDD